MPPNQCLLRWTKFEGRGRSRSSPTVPRIHLSNKWSATDIKLGTAGCDRLRGLTMAKILRVLAATLCVFMASSPQRALCQQRTPPSKIFVGNDSAEVALEYLCTCRCGPDGPLTPTTPGWAPGDGDEDEDEDNSPRRLTCEELNEALCVADSGKESKLQDCKKRYVSPPSPTDANFGQATQNTTRKGSDVIGESSW